MKILRSIAFYFVFLSLFTASITSAHLKKDLEKIIQEYLANNFVNASFMFSQEDNILGYGANGIFSKSGQRLTANQIMPIAANINPIIAAAVLRLQDKGLLHINDKIIKHLPQNSDLWQSVGDIPKWAYKITIHNLLTHSSGLIDYTKQEDLITSSDVHHKLINSKILKTAATYPLEFRPGSRYQYSNTNSVILGLIIEQVSNKKLSKFLQEEFFKPLDMHFTHLSTMKEMLEMHSNKETIYPQRYFVTPNNTNKPEFNEATTDFLLVPYADSGIYSNTTDLIKWYKALFTGKILSKSSYEMMTKKYFAITPKLGKKTHVGYGMFISKLTQNNFVFHSSGDIAGITSEAGYIPHLDLYFAIISNVSEKPPTNVNINLELPYNQLNISNFLKYIIGSL